MSFTTIKKPSKAILIDAHNSNELRVAIVDNTKKKQHNILTDLHIEDKKRELYKANIYKGKISSIEPSLNAVFVYYDDGKRHGFLPFKEIDTQYFGNIESPKVVPTPQEDTSTPSPEAQEQTPPTQQDSDTNGTQQTATFIVEDDDKKQKRGPSNDQIAQSLKIGQEVLVQIVKEERGTKGAALTTFISLAGSYLVLMPNSPSVKGISRRIEGSARDEAKHITADLNCPEDMGFIIRTAGINQPANHLQWDLDVLINLWSAIQAEMKHHEPPVLMHQESDVISCAVRDHLRQDITDLVVNDQAALDKIKQYISQIKPQFVENVHLYDDDTPMFAHFGIENQIEQAHQREVRLPSGGAIIIDQTEALIAVDVNSARAKGTDIEDTAFQTNIEAAEELAKQLRLRDIGGLIVIDFIDMSQNKHQRDVESHLKKCLQEDKARLRLGKISSFGLLEMSRQRLRSSLGEVTKITCPRCNGQGMIQSVESISLSLIRKIREDVLNEQLLQLQIHVPLEVSAQLMNHHRDQISDIETSGKTSVIIVPNPNFQSPQFKIKKIRFSDKATKAAQMESKSYQLIEPHRNQYQHEKQQRQKQANQDRSTPVVNAQEIADAHSKAPQVSLVKRLWDGIFNSQPVKVKSHTSAEVTDDNIGNRKSTNQNKKSTHNRRPRNHNKKNHSNKKPGTQKDKQESQSNRQSQNDKKSSPTNKQNHPKKPRQDSQTQAKKPRQNTQKKQDDKTDHKPQQPKASKPPKAPSETKNDTN